MTEPNAAPDPIDFYCMFCSAARGTPCTDLTGDIVPPHRQRRRMAEMAAGLTAGWRS